MIKGVGGCTENCIYPAKNVQTKHKLYRNRYGQPEFEEFDLPFRGKLWSCPDFVDMLPLGRGGRNIPRSKPPYPLNTELRQKLIELVRAGVGRDEPTCCEPTLG